MNPRHLPHDWYSRPLPTNVEMGERSWLYSAYAFRHYASQATCGLRVGSNSGIYHGTFFNLGPEGEVRIGDYCTLVGVTLATRAKVSIGDYSLLSHEVVIADHCWSMPDRAAVRPVPDPAGDIEIGANVWIGARAVLLGPLRIGEGAIVGAASVVTQDVPPFCLWAGNPGRVVRELT